MAKKAGKKNKAPEKKNPDNLSGNQNTESKSYRLRQDPSRDWILSSATILLTTAAAVCILMVIATFLLPDGRAAVAAIGGFPAEPTQPRTMQWFMLLDTLFPMFYGSGIAALAAGLQTRGNRALVRLALTAVLAGVVADFAENATIYSAISDAVNIPAYAKVLTVVKYASLAFGGILISIVLPPIGAAGILAKAVARYAFPVGIALLVSGIGGDTARGLVGLGFPAALILLAVYAQSLLVAETS